MPRRVFVELNERGLPVAISTVRRFDGSTVGEIEITRTAELPNRRTVEAIGEVWRVDDEWWRQPICRRYVEVMFEGGKHAVLYQDQIAGEWFEQTP
ncbi:MAG: hypothetical protein HY560_11885 [Gemmatimonadetes bacterium]|nr:hypothetical protein [Gemmatimonadota bacterium]